MKEYWLSQYGYIISLALVTPMLILNITILVKLRYGDGLMTHISERHYIISLCLLLFMFTYLLVFLIHTQVLYKDDLYSLLKKINYPGNF